VPHPSPAAEQRPPDPPGAGLALGCPQEVTLAALRARGAPGFDPIGWRVIEALAGRAADQTDAVRQLLAARLATLLAAFQARFEPARTEAAHTLARVVQQCPQAAEALRPCLASGDFKRLHRLADALQEPGPASSLADLVRHLDLQTAAPEARRLADPVAAAGGAPAELKAVRYFRSTWSRLSVDQQLTRSFARVPENAGPLNSHLLVLRALKLMRETSPAYLSRFMSLVDTLWWLDQAEVGGAPGQAAAARGDADKKRKTGRGRAG
jgi:hypothetical protein